MTYILSDAFPGTRSADGQDVFVATMLKEKRNGFFIEVGTAMPIENNNTFIFEYFYGWQGILFEFSPVYEYSIRQCRTSPLITKDATEVDYRALFKKHNVPKVIDYLSLDIDPPENTLKVLKALPLDEYTFSCITFEHDRYCSGDSVMHESREIFKEHGYKLEVADAMCPLGPYEDWYIYEGK